MSGLLTLDEARGRLLDGVAPVEAERVPLEMAGGRVLAEAVTAGRAQPPAALSAMDGYAVGGEAPPVGSRFDVIGESVGGAPFGGRVGEGQAIRIATGALIPEGVDRVVVQEDCERDGAVLTVVRAPGPSRFVRSAGLDFGAGDAVLPAGAALTPGRLALAAAANRAALSVYRRPRVLILSSGDELVTPGGDLRPSQTIDAASFGVAALLAAWGAEVVRGGVLPDSQEAATAAAREHVAGGYDLVVTIGGASVSHRDVLGPAFEAAGAALVFAGVAVRPGKPFWHARAARTLVAGLPGNPSSAMVTARLLAVPLAARLAGLPDGVADRAERRPLETDLPDPGGRETWHRARLTPDGALMPDRREDSSLLSPFADATHLVRQAPGEALPRGSLADCLVL